MADLQKMIYECTEVLETNKSDGYTVPSREIYPHQWFWDSCFTAIGLRHIDIDRAKQELISLKRGAWTNGMLPNIIFRDKFLDYDHRLWKSHDYAESPLSFNTTALTQPPMLAEAIVKVGEHMEQKDRLEWYAQMFDTLLNYHQWLYNERDPKDEGLIVLIHPYESGMDNTPPWLHMMHKMRYPWWVKAMSGHGLEVVSGHMRRDTGYIPSSQRIGLKESIECFYLVRQLKKQHYILNPKKRKLPAIQDLGFNSILVRANKLLVKIAREIGEPLPADLNHSIRKTEKALESLWDPKTQHYYSRNFHTGKLIKTSSVATLLPLYAGSIDQDRAWELANMLEDRKSYATTFPVPTVARNSSDFNSENYWQGPVWININWLIAEGLRSYRFERHADDVIKSSLSLVSYSGPYEYFSTLDGLPKGAKNFSWSAALAIDMASTSK